MTRSLSVLLPVHNAEATLQSDVGRMLDVLPDLSRDFDVIVIDDGSTDDTSEVAADLSAQFPQVKLMRSPQRQGLDAALQTGLAKTNAAVVLARTGCAGVKESEMLRVWREEDGGESGFRFLRRDPPETGAMPAAAERQTAPATAAKRSAGRPAFLARLKSFKYGE